MTDDRSSVQCEYVFDPKEWAERTGRPARIRSDVFDEDGCWSCPHEAGPDRDYCVFHLPLDKKSDETVRETLLTQIRQSGAESNQFIGARFGALDLSKTSLESDFNHQIDFRYAEFEGQVTFEDAVVNQPLTLDGAIFYERANFNGVTFEGELYCSSVVFHEEGWFNETDITSGGWFWETEFGKADFSMSTFEGKADFRDATFEHTHFRETTFEQRAEFHGATLDHAMFSGVHFQDLTYFTTTTLPERANFRHARFDEKVSFAHFSPISDTCYVDLRDATVAAGALVQPIEGVALYDFKNATVGDVTLSEDAGADLLSHYRFLETTFDGFDVGQYRDSLTAADWLLHEFEPVPGFDAEEAETPSPGTLESTYLKAKNGADDIGDTNVAAEFFRTEMLYRRRQHRAQLHVEDELRPTLAAGFRWTANLLLDLTSGYGERPSRTVLTSLCVIGAFAVVFAVAWPVQPYDHPTGTFVLSLESFVGVIVGGAVQVDNPWVRLLVSLEGFVGAFLIALFVFALTRSIHR